MQSISVEIVASIGTTITVFESATTSLRLERGASTDITKSLHSQLYNGLYWVAWYKIVEKLVQSVIYDAHPLGF